MGRQGGGWGRKEKHRVPERVPDHVVRKLFIIGGDKINDE